jgi:hypothetical protein
MSPRAPDPDTAAWLDAIAAGLAAAGLATQVHDTRGVLDVTARLDQPVGQGVEVIFEDDSYCQVSYWHPPGASPAQVVATIAAVLAAITTSDIAVPG